MMNMTYIGYMNIGPISMKLNLFVNPVIQSMTSFNDARSSRSTTIDDETLISSINTFFSTIGEVTLDINSSITDSNLSFPVYEGVSVFETTEEVGKRLLQWSKEDVTTTNVVQQPAAPLSTNHLNDYQNAYGK